MWYGLALLKPGDDVYMSCLYCDSNFWVSGFAWPSGSQPPSLTTVYALVTKVALS